MEKINMSQMTAYEVIETVQTATSIEPLRMLAKDLNVSFSGNTGIDTLRTKLVAHLNTFTESNSGSRQEFSEPDFDTDFDPEEIEVNVPKPKPAVHDLMNMDPSEVEDVNLRRQVIRAQALRLVRVRITNLDPNDSALNGAIISLQNKYTGKVAKYIPYGDESINGYHIPWMMYEYLQQWKFPLRKEVKGGRFGVKTYKTTMAPKFSIEILPPLTMDELKELANHQRAAQSIDSAA